MNIQVFFFADMKGNLQLVNMNIKSGLLEILTPWTGAAGWNYVDNKFN